MRRPLALLAYGFVALAIAFEVATLWFMLHPQVPPDYRAYYIDQTTTCLNQPVSGDYAFGSTVSFRSDGAALAKPLRVCGWEGPAGDGTHAVGETSRLRFALPAGENGPMVLNLELVAIRREGVPQQRVVVRVNGAELRTVSVSPETPTVFEVPVPADVVRAGKGRLDVFLDYPDAVRMSPTDSNTRLRSVKLLSAQVLLAS